ncbi:SRPBCC family protein [Roseivirga seohaensis]|uniref:SRPBCC family protein n=1 Tax=Roseivirga seohaensis TaxID=1914963 RepID=UPI003BAA067B
MKIKISTKVEQDLTNVKDGFNESLFIRLSPPFPKVELNRYDGCKSGDIVGLTLNFFLFKQEWISKIIDQTETEQRFDFIDIGIKLPVFFNSWKHKHIMEQQEAGTMIVDDIEYSTPFLLLNYILYPLIYFQFLYRKPIYRKWFKKRYK